MLLCLSIDHRDGAFPLLERIERRTDAVTRALADPDLADGSVVLATCNRFEVYLDVPAGPGGAAPGRSSFDRPEFERLALARLAQASAIPHAEIEAAAEVHSGHRAAEHLFAVAGGLKSAMVGEEEIAGQVRRAHTRARSAGTMTHRLERLFQTATRTSREIKQRTRIHSAGRSLVRLALLLAESRLDSWADARVLLIGTGAYAGATAAALRDRGAGHVRVYSPSGRADAFAASRGLDPVHAAELADALASSDIVIACSRAQDPLLAPADLVADAAADPDAVANAAEDPAARGSAAPPTSRLLIDLGMPRNIDPAVSRLPGIELLDLETIAKHAPVPELSAEAEARDIVRDAAAEFAASQAERDAVPAVGARRGHVLAILEDALGRVRRSSDSPADAARRVSAEPGTAQQSTAEAADVEAALRHFAGRLLHEPTTRIRGLGREGRADEANEALAALFGVEPARVL